MRTKRQQRFWDLQDFAQGQGLEIGPLHSPIVRRDDSDVRYVDVYLRPQLLEHYGNDPHIDHDDVPEIDFGLIEGDTIRTLPEAIGDAGPFDWVVASHVVEHVPDLVAWLDEVAEVTTDHGRLLLAVPDRRYCFDVHRPGTSVGQVLEAHERGDKVPSVRAVYDYKRGHAGVIRHQLWKGRPPGYENRVFDLPTVLAEVERARRGEYVDAHVWTFTPGTFVEQVVELRELGLTSWAVDSVEPTVRGELEFMVVLRRLPRDEPWDDALLATEPAPAAMPDWLAEQVEWRERVRRQRQRADRLRTRVDRLQQRSKAQRARIRELEAQLDATVPRRARRGAGRVVRAVRRRTGR